MNNLLDIFNRNDTVRAYASCRRGGNKDIYGSFVMQINAAFDKVAAENEILRKRDHKLYKYGIELITVLDKILLAMPLPEIEITSGQNITEKIEKQLAGTQRLIRSLVFNK